MGKQEKYIKIGEAASYLGVTTQTLRNYEKKGLLVPVVIRDSGHRLYSIAQLEDFKKEKMEENV